jgi:hypothetical protein
MSTMMHACGDQQHLGHADISHGKSCLLQKILHSVHATSVKCRFGPTWQVDVTLFTRPMQSSQFSFQRGKSTVAQCVCPRQSHKLRLVHTLKHCQSRKSGSTQAWMHVLLTVCGVGTHSSSGKVPDGADRVHSHQPAVTDENMNAQFSRGALFLERYCNIM